MSFFKNAPTYKFEWETERDWNHKIDLKLNSYKYIHHLLFADDEVNKVQDKKNCKIHVPQIKEQVLLIGS